MTHNCPICSQEVKGTFLQVDGFPILRCHHCATDFVAPAPSDEQMKEYYDRADWFEGGERGGYVSYDVQTDEAPAWLVRLMDTIEAKNASPSILDIGCAYGTHLSLAQQRGWQCFGVEPSLHARQIAQQRHKRIFVTETIDEIPPHKFDLVLMLEVIEHLSDPRPLFYKMFAEGQISPETVVAMTTPNARSWAAMADPAGWEFRHPPSHLTFYSGLTFKTLLQRLRFREIDIEGQHPLKDSPFPIHDDEDHSMNGPLSGFAGLKVIATGSDFSSFMQERFVPGTWSELTAYEHFPRYQLARKYAEGKRVLDFGCGSGYGAKVLAQVANHVLAVDIDDGALDFASAEHRHINLEFAKVADLCDSFGEAEFDLVTCFEVIEHLTERDQKILINNFRRILRPDGLLIISTPNPEITKLYGENPFHLKEMSLDEFKGALGEKFDHSIILSQSLISGSTLVLSSNEESNLWHSAPMYDSKETRSSVPAAWVLLCSSSPLPQVQSHFFFDNERNFIRHRIQELNTRHLHEVKIYEETKRSAEFETAMEVAMVENDGLKLALSKGIAEREALKEELNKTHDTAIDDAKLENDSLKSALSHRSAELEALRRELQQTRETLANCITEREAFRLELEQTHEKMANCIIEREAFRRELEQTREKMANRITEQEALKVELDGAHTQIASLLQQKLAYQSRLEIIEGSLRWTLMNKLAGVAPPLRPIFNRIRNIRTDFAQRVGASPASTVQEAGWEASPAHESENGPKPAEIIVSTAQENLDLAYETAREPKWNANLGSYELTVDEVYRSRQTAKTGVLKNLVAPYVLRPKAVVEDPKSLPKVLHVIPNVFVGGSTQLIIDIVEHLSDVFQHEVVTSAFWPAGQHVGLTAHHVTLSNMRTLQTLLREMQPDLVHIHYWGLTDSPWYWAVMEQLEKFPMLPIVENVNTPVDPLISPRINKYIFVSKYVRTEFGGNLPSELTSIIYPGIDLDRFSLPYDGEDAENAVGMVYRLEDDKLTIHAIDLFIEIVKRRPRTRVYIVGGGSFLEPWIRKTEEQGVRQNFRFTGYVPYEELPDWYNRFSVFIAPVWKESFGQVAPFAMSKQIVVTGYRIGALPEIAGSEDFFGTGVEDTAKIIVDLLEDRERRSQIGRHNQKRARSLFSVGTMVSAYERLYREVLAGRPLHSTQPKS